MLERLRNAILPAGDYVLRASSALVMDAFVAPTDLFARMGGAEFVIV